MASSTLIKPYTTEFYDEALLISVRSARQIIPMIIELLNPASIVDLGCGPGSWLFVATENGIKDIFGIDGPWVNRNELKIPADKFLTHDLNTPLRLDRKFDLVLSLEVAEHLSRQSANTLVDSLVALGDMVLFSAAIPFQGGTNHINEQWPEYWAEKFRLRKYRVVDCFRNRLWQNENVAYWFAQNMLLYVKEELLEQQPRLAHYARLTEHNYLSRIHPKTFLKSRETLSNPKTILMRKVWNVLPRYIRVRLVRHLGHKLWEQVNTSY